ncbi:MAG: hypothetical protein ACOCV1_07435 [Bacillota bacterium]
MTFQSEKGFAYIFILFFILLLGILSYTFTRQGIVDNQLNKNMADRKKAVYAAEAAVEMGRSVIVREGELPDFTLDGSEYVAGDLYCSINLSDNRYFELYIENSQEGNNYLLIGYGFAGELKEIIKTEVDSDGMKILPDPL